MAHRFEIPLDIPDVNILDVKVKQDEVHITVESTVRHSRCPQCGKQLTKVHGHDRERVLRHLSILGKPTYIHIRPLRFVCERCAGRPTTTQQVEWYESGSSQTKAYEEYLLLQLVNSTVMDVEKKEGVGYETVMGVINRRVMAEVDWSKIPHLEVLGVDEIALKKGHKDFVAIITGRVGDKKLILGVLENREKATVKAFFSSIPQRLRKTLRAICTDMYEGFIAAAKEVFAKRVRIVVDRFHVARLYRSSVDALRKKELRRLKKELPAEEFKRLKGAMWALRRSLQKRTPKDEAVLRELFKHSPDLETAYYLSGILTNIFNTALSKRQARWQMRRWIALTTGSGLECFDKFLGTLDKALEEILNYLTDRDNSGFVEGLNNKIKVIKRRCYGILNRVHLFQRLYLDLGNYHDLSARVRYS